MKSYEVRNKFIKYFERNGHTPVSSSGLIPENDNTLMFANAGMNQFKNVFTGLEKRPYVRAVSSQKCVRAGGKHNDLENVGFTARHHTFFEMLGNFSFGDYFKKDAIRFAWEFLTKECGISKDKLSVTVFETDDEAANIWHEQEGVPRQKIFRFGEKDNFWRMGDVGPCGPCSEIFYDHGPEAGCGKPTCNVGCSCDRYVEIWNLVFMQFYEDESGKQTPLPKPSVDTGAGLERVTAALQGKKNNYDTDLFEPMISAACKIAKIKYDDKHASALRVLADHARSTAFLIADGVIPTNEGRGYVLRRIMRRAIRYGRNLTKDESLFPKVVSAVIESMEKVYPELRRGVERISTMTKDEVTRFVTTLDQGTEILNTEIKKMAKQKEKTVSGAIAFKLYDTFGFPLDLTQLIAREHGYAVDVQTFEREMAKARDVAKSSWKGGGIESDRAHILALVQQASKGKKVTKFTGYEKSEGKGKIVLLSDGKNIVKSLSSGSKGLVISDSTPFYGEGGGQVGDSGKISNKGDEATVLNTTKENDIFIHHVEVTSGTLKTGSTYTLTVDPKRRSTASNHSATHLLHSALRKTLGSHVSQAGSHVNEERLRFDFTHNSPLTAEERRKIEELVNGEISKGIEVETKIMSPKKAVDDEGALAMFGEKYGDKVRVLKMGDFSVELCGGTHVHNTSDILAFKIVSEGSVSAGVRRVEAITGSMAIKYLLKNTNEYLQTKETISANENWQQFMERTTNPVIQWIENSRNETKNLERQMKQAQSQKVDVDAFVQNAQNINLNGQDAKLASAILEMDDRQVLSDIADKMKNKLGSGIVVVIGKGESTHPIIVTVSSNLTQKIKAGDVLKNITQVMGGKGGGRPDFAQGAGSDFSKAKAALETFKA